MRRYNRRQTLVLGSALASGSLLAAPSLAQGKATVVVLGGGFGGASAARVLKRTAPGIDVVLVTDADRFTTCPFSNLVIAGERKMAEITFTYDRLAAEGVRVVIGRARSIDTAGNAVAARGRHRLAL